MLMPLAFATILASSVTLIGTSTNVVVSGLMTQSGMPPIGMFELTIVGLPILIVGLLYMFFIGTRLIPEREVPEELTEEFNLRPYLTEIKILPGSPLAGLTLAESSLGRDLDLTVMRVMRDEGNFLVPQADLVLDAGDILLIEGQRDNLLALKNTTLLGAEANGSVSDIDLETEGTHLAEVILMPRSPLIGRRLYSRGLRDQYGIQVLAINRHEETIHRQISQVRLRMGDVLLVQGIAGQLSSLERDNTFRILGTIENQGPIQSEQNWSADIRRCDLLGSDQSVFLPWACSPGPDGFLTIGLSQEAT